ncbi:copper-translocating P-type ATPase [Vulcanimicrobium alpinum]|uniref:Copper-translocating P-type ATPase n=1 Tax=Vulcanimicrobium alpinum TaxID=3016050 RepID=A0AAN1XTV9_UNVUL|nr:cation-translocating P-type ATPase [Vulcanimicrobium alpinum]BDE05522.1 copper-translocating P-type ATPase [Vulcanimicrobium alpinum]
MSDRAAPEHAVEHTDLIRIALVALAAAAVWFRWWEPYPHVSIIGIVATVAGGWPIFAEAFENLRERTMTMELSMTIALVAALAIGEFFTALVITAFVLAAEVLEGLTVARGRHAIRDLIALMPRAATVRRDGILIDIDASDVRPGDDVVVKPGALLPVDGIVTAGRSFVDQAAIAGESMAVEKAAGAYVYAGTINQSGALDVRADKVGRDTSFGKIVEAVETAERSRAPAQRLADRLSGYLVYFALGAAALTYALTRDPRSTISVVIVAGACGIAAGTPLAILGAIGRAARGGSIIKGGRYLESLSTVDTVVLDKTGTVTYGTPRIARIAAAASGERELLRIAASVEQRSEHPLASAIVARAREDGIALAEPDDFSYVPGRGIRAIVEGEAVFVGNAAFFAYHALAVPVDGTDPGATTVLVARGTDALGTIAIADVVRDEAAGAIAALASMGIRTVLLTGDVQRVAEATGRALGVDEIIAEMLPEQKSAYVAELVQKGRTVAMVGDGINDAPALAAATVGVAMGSGTDVARESADVVLLGNDLARFVETIRIARRTRAIVMQNFAGTLAVDSVGILLAGFGLLNPLLAAFIHVASELTFILNSTRMLPGRAPSPVAQSSSKG